MPSVSELLVRIDATTVQLRRELATADRSLSDFANKTDRSLSNVDASFGRLGAGIGKIQGLLGGLGVAMGGLELAKSFVEMADASTNMENRLKSVTGSAAELTKAQDLLYQSSQENKVETSTSVELYARLSRALQGTGADTERVVEMVDTLSKVVRLSGASTAEASGALLQFSQAMNKGVLNGEEFNSMAENLPMLLEAIAQQVATLNGISLDQAKAELKEMSEEGTLTTDIIVGATENMRDGVVKAFGEMETTAGGAATQMWNALTRLVGKIDDVTNISGGLVGKIEGVAAAFDFGIGALDRYGGALSTLLGWINSIPHPLSLLAQAAGAAAAQVSQAAGEIEAAMKRAGAARAEMGSGVQPWQAGPGEGPKWGGNITRSSKLGDLTKGVNASLDAIEAKRGAREVPVSTSPQDVIGALGGGIDFTALGVGPGKTVTGVGSERPKLKFYKAPSKEAEKAAKTATSEDERAIAQLRKETMTERDKYQARVAELDDLVQRQKIPEELYKEGLAAATADYQRSTAPKPAKKSGGAAPKKRATGGGGGKSEADREQERAISEGQSVFKQTRTDAEAYSAEIERLDELLARNAITQDTHARAVAAADEAMRKGTDGFGASQQAAQEYLDEVSKLQGALATGSISQDEYNFRLADLQSKYSDAESGAAAYAEEIARLDAALAEGAISQEQHAASVDMARSRLNKGLEEAARLYEETRTPLERYNEETRKLSELWAEGLIGDDTKMRKAADLMEQLKNETLATNEAFRRAQNLADDLGSAFAGAFEDAIIEGGKLKDILNGLWEDIQRIVIRQMVTVPLASGISALLGGVAGAMVGAPALGAAGGFQHGGPVSGSGTGTSDSIPAIMPGGGLARLSNGEFIINASSASRHAKLIRAINSGQISPQTAARIEASLGTAGRHFATGGPVGNLHSATTSAPTSGPIEIKLENKSSAPLKLEGAQQRKGPNGGAMISVMITDAVKAALSSGEFDKAMGSRYGAAVQPIGR